MHIYTTSPNLSTTSSAMDGFHPKKPEEEAEYDPFTEFPDKDLQAGLAGHMKREAGPSQPPWAQHSKRPRIQPTGPPMAPAMAAAAVATPAVATPGMAAAVMTAPAMAAPPMSPIYPGQCLQPQAMQGYGLSMPMAMPPHQQYGPAMQPCFHMQMQAQGAPTALSQQQFAPTVQPGQLGCHAAPTNCKACPGPSCAPTVGAPQQVMATHANATPPMMCGTKAPMPDDKQTPMVAMTPKLPTPMPPQTPPPKSMPMESHAPQAVVQSGSMPVKVEAHAVEESPGEYEHTYSDDDWGTWSHSWSARGGHQNGQEWQSYYTHDTKEEENQDEWDVSWKYESSYGSHGYTNDENGYDTSDQESKEWVTGGSYGYGKGWKAKNEYNKGYGQRLWNPQLNKGWEMKAAYLVEAYLDENWDRCSALCSKLLGIIHLLVGSGVFRMFIPQTKTYSLATIQYAPHNAQCIRFMTNHKFRELVARAKEQCDLAKKLDDGWPESEERYSEICKSEDGIA